MWFGAAYIYAGGWLSAPLGPCRREGMDKPCLGLGAVCGWHPRQCRQCCLILCRALFFFLVAVFSLCCYGSALACTSVRGRWCWSGVICRCSIARAVCRRTMPDVCWWCCTGLLCSALLAAVAWCREAYWWSVPCLRIVPVQRTVLAAMGFVVRRHFMVCAGVMQRPHWPAGG